MRTPLPWQPSFRAPARGNDAGIVDAGRPALAEFKELPLPGGSNRSRYSTMAEQIKTYVASNPISEWKL